MILAAHETYDSLQGAGMNDLPEKLLLTAEEVAHQLSMSTKTLDTWRQTGKGPPFIRLSGVGGGRGVRYPLDKLKAWISEQQ